MVLALKITVNLCLLIGTYMITLKRILRKCFGLHPIPLHRMQQKNINGKFCHLIKFIYSLSLDCKKNVIFKYLFLNNNKIISRLLLHKMLSINCFITTWHLIGQFQLQSLLIISFLKLIFILFNLIKKISQEDFFFKNLKISKFLI